MHETRSISFDRKLLRLLSIIVRVLIHWNSVSILRVSMLRVSMLRDMLLLLLDYLEFGLSAFLAGQDTH